MNRALYRKYRSKSLNEIVGQDHITHVLERALSSGSTGHAYLLTGPRGTGKTSVARILAHEINKLPYTDESDHLDIIEIDAASNNGIDDVRDLRDKALIAPISADKKVYIIDEVHMLSKQAFNALLKILEEPPAHVVFILATTDFDKVPDTIVSRTQRFHFHLVDVDKITSHLGYIAKQEDIKIEKSALKIIAERGGGSFRDSISLLDQMRNISDESITASLVEKTLGLATQDDIDNLLNSILSLKPKNIITSLQNIEDKGVSATTIASQLLSSMRKDIVNNPTYVHYLEGLSSVAKSPHPDIALLVSLMELASKSDTSISDPIQQKTKKSESNSNRPKTVSATAGSRLTPKILVNIDSSKIKVKPQGDTPGKKPKNTLVNFEWQKILDFAEADKSKSIGIYSLLTKCSPSFKDGTLTLYAGNNFCKNRLDSTKNRVLLSQIVSETHSADIEIITLAQAAPPKDEQAAKIAAMMGGGEEVDV